MWRRQYAIFRALFRLNLNALARSLLVNIFTKVAGSKAWKLSARLRGGSLALILKRLGAKKVRANFDDFSLFPDLGTGFRQLF